MTGVHQIEYAIGEHDRARLTSPPGDGLGDGFHLAPGLHHDGSLGREPKSTFRPGGAMKVVAMTISRMAPNTASLRTPARRPMSAKMRPTSPRGIIPTPTTRRRNLAQGAAHPAASLPTTASSTKTPATPSNPPAPS